MKTIKITDTFEGVKQVLEQERQELAEEQRAFEQFAKRLTTLETATSTPVGPTTHIHDRSVTGLSAVRNAYIETVMSVSHYTERYGDTWIESIAEEFSAELAVAIEDHVTLQPRLKRLLLTAAKQAAANREQFLNKVEVEREAIETAENKIISCLEEIHSLLNQPLPQMEFNALHSTRTRLENQQEQCDKLAKKRQAEIRQRHRTTVDNVGTLEHYFYQECENTYPILAAIAKLSDLIEQTLNTVDQFLGELIFGTTKDRSECVHSVRT